MRWSSRESATCCGAIAFVEASRRRADSSSSASACAWRPNDVSPGGNRQAAGTVCLYMSVTTSELKRFRAEKDRVFARDPHSPLTADQRRDFHGLEYFDENP